MNVTRIHLEEVNRAMQERAAYLQQARTASQQLVGLTFFNTILQKAYDNPLKGPYGHGGRGEEMFRNQLNMALADKVAASGSFELPEQIYEQMTRRYRQDTPDVKSEIAPSSTLSVMG